MRTIPYSLFALWFKRLGYEPYPEQSDIHRELMVPGASAAGEVLPRVVVVTGGEQAGKSQVAGNHVAGRALFDRIIWLVGDRYEDCEKEYQYCLEAAIAADMTRPGMYSTAQVGPWEMRLRFHLDERNEVDLAPGHGCVIKTLSSEDVTKLAREAPDGIVMCEPGRQTPEAFRALLRRAIPRSAWFLVAGTLETDATGWFADLFTTCESADNPYGGVSIPLPSYANRSLYPLGEGDPKFQAGLQMIRETNLADAEEEIGERFYGRPRKAKGLVFFDFSERLHVSTQAERIPGMDVHLLVDPGWFPSAYAVLFVQFLGEQVRVFDEIYVHQRRTADIIALVKNHDCFPSVTNVWFDPFAFDQHQQGQDSSHETWTAALQGRGITVSAPPRFSEIDGRNRLHDKMLFDVNRQQPYLLLHPRVKNLAWEFTKGYKLNQRADGTFASDEPIDRNNHAIKALTYGVVARYGKADIERHPLPGPTIQRGPWDRRPPGLGGGVRGAFGGKRRFVRPAFLGSDGLG